MRAMQIPDTPMFLVAFGPFLSGENLQQPDVVQPLSIQSADQGLELLHPSLYIPLPQSISPEAGIELLFTSLDDFTPDAIVARTPWLRALRDADRAGPGPSTPAATTLDRLLEMVELPGKQAEPAPLPSDGGGEAETLVSAVLTRIFSDEDFRRMEAAWQGVALLFAAAGKERLRLALVPVTGENATRVLATGADRFDDDPPDLLLVDTPFDATPVGMQLLQAAADLGERQMAPAICWFGPGFLQLDTWPELDHLPYLPNHLNTFAYAQWQALRDQSAAFWVVAACNRFRMDAACPGQFGLRKPNYLAPVWGLAALLLQAKASTGSPLGLTSQVLGFREAASAAGPSLEFAVTADRACQMVESGLLPLVLSARHGVRLIDARTINGTSILSPLILSTIIHTLIDLRKNNGPVSDPELLATFLEAAFSLHPRFKGLLPVGSVAFEAVGKDADDQTLLGVTLQQRALGGEDIEFTFTW